MQKGPKRWLFAFMAFALLATSSGPALADDTEDVPYLVASEYPPLDNLELVRSLAPLDRCLFDLNVFPAGGIGYKNSALPYDAYSAIDAALMTFRAQIMRNNVDLVMGVARYGRDHDTDRLGVVVDSRTAGTKPPTVESLVGEDIDARAALETLTSNGIGVDIELREALPIRRLCELRENFHSLGGSESGPMLYVAPDLQNGALHVTSDTKSEEQIRELAREFGRDVIVDVEDIQLTSRLSDNPSPAGFSGGARLHPNSGQVNVNACSNSFRINGNTILSADHCPANASGAYYNSNRLVGYRYGSLQAAADVDAVLVAGKTYSGKIYVGPAATESKIAANGVVPMWLFPIGGSLVISGSTSWAGQDAILYGGWAGGTEPGCLVWNYLRCQMHVGVAPPDTCIGGDSGGPVGMYEPANGRIVPAGIVTGAGSNRKEAHHCFFTNMQSIQYLYGGTTVG